MCLTQSLRQISTAACFLRIPCPTSACISRLFHVCYMHYAYHYVGFHKFATYLEAISQFQASELQYEASSTLRTLRNRTPPYKMQQRGIYARLPLSSTFLRQDIWQRTQIVNFLIFLLSDLYIFPQCPTPRHNKTHCSLKQRNRSPMCAPWVTRHTSTR